MEKELDRRSFLKVTALTGAALFIGDIFPSRGFAQSTAAIPESEKIIIAVITDNLADATRPHYKIARRHLGTGSFLERALHAEHGLSYHVETTVNGQPHQFLFDFATDFQGVKRNIDLLKIDFKKIEALALSHDHFDQQAALVELLKAKQNEIPKGIPFYVGEPFFVGTYIKTPDGNIAGLLALKRKDSEPDRHGGLMDIHPVEMVRRLSTLMSNKTLASRIGIAQSTVSMYRVGKRQKLRKPALERLMELYTRCQQAGLI